MRGWCGAGRRGRARAEAGEHGLVRGRLEDLVIEHMNVKIDHQRKIAVFHGMHPRSRCGLPLLNKA